MNVTTPNGLIIKSKQYFQEVASMVSKKRHLLNLFNFFIGVQFIYPVISSIIVFALTNISKNTPILISFLANLIGTIVAIYLMLPDVLDGLRIFRENLKGNIKLILKYFLFIMIGNVVINLIIMFFTGELTTPNNQDSISQIFMYNPRLMTIIIIGFAPITEELLFRNTIFRKAFEHYGVKKALFISAFVFGFMHVLMSVLDQDYSDLINIFLYMHMGLQMGLIYFKSGNIIAPMLLHFLNNLFSLLALFGLL